MMSVNKVTLNLLLCNWEWILISST